MIELAGEVLSAVGAHVTMKEAGGWRVHHHYGASSAEVGQFFSDSEAPGAVHVAETRQPLVVHDALDPGATVSSELVAQLGYRSALAYPLLRKDDVVGVVSFLFAEPQASFSDLKLDFVSRLAYMISTVEENARLLQAQQAELATHEGPPGGRRGIRQHP